MTAHPWSPGFTWEDHAGPFELVTPEQAKAFDEDGFFLFEDALDHATLTRLQDEIDPLERDFVSWLDQQGGVFANSDASAITFPFQLTSRSAWLRQFCASELFAGLAADLVGPDVSLYWDQAVYKKPEPVRKFPWHQDNGYAFLLPEPYLTCWIPLVDATSENGCPVIAPGRHRQGTILHRDSPHGRQCFDHAEDAVPVPAKAGSVVVFSSLTPHFTGPNLSDATRKAYIVQFIPTGALMYLGDPQVEDKPAPTRQGDLAHQFPVLVGGQRVEPAPFTPRAMGSPWV
jgi:ectoine hydroxylase-related dioxygenase (phytanoyl-CoA dioxygenase family)